METKNSFTFDISLSVLNHLGRNLYRSFATVLGEAVSNAWDADAQNVWIHLDVDKNSFSIKDDGVGMTADDFQNKFLKIGYSKRKKGASRSSKDRPFIGRKGIGKLALLSCAERVSVISKVKGGEYVGGTIDNRQLDLAITEDKTAEQYPLGAADISAFGSMVAGHRHGTIIRFEGIKDGVKRTFEFLSKVIALYFRFSLLDPTFKIFLNNERITHKHLQGLADKTEFLWIFDGHDDPYVQALEKAFAMDPRNHECKHLKQAGVTGFVASVEKPRDLSIMGTDERVGVDLFVNGRLREHDILKHIPTARIAQSYLYGQLHFDGLDDKTDRFTSSREGIVADDPKFQAFLDSFRKAVLKIVDEWDGLRLKRGKDGDSENDSVPKTKRASIGLYHAVAKDYETVKRKKATDKVDEWVEALSEDASFNFESYAECFISENLVRRFIQEEGIALTPEAQTEADTRKKNEDASKNKGNISIAIRKRADALSYLSMDFLAHLVDAGDKSKRDAHLIRDADEFKPMRDAMAHTALLTDEAKKRLATVRENIKARVKTLLAPKK